MGFFDSNCEISSVTSSRVSLLARMPLPLPSRKSISCCFNSFASTPSSSISSSDSESDDESDDEFESPSFNDSTQPSSMESAGGSNRAATSSPSEVCKTSRTLISSLFSPPLISISLLASSSLETTSRFYKHGENASINNAKAHSTSSEKQSPSTWGGTHV